MSYHSRFLQLSTIFIFLATGCGVSPLFNHLNADELKSQSADAPTNECQFTFAKAGLCASLTWTKQPTEDEGGRFTVQFWKKGGSPKGPFTDPGHKVNVKLWMPSMGHGSSPVKIAAGAPGVFYATEVFFVMPGKWEIWLQLKEGTTVFDEAKIDFKL